MAAGFIEEGCYELPRTVKLEGSSTQARSSSDSQAIDLSVGFIDGGLPLNEQLGIPAAFACLDFNVELHDTMYCTLSGESCIPARRIFGQADALHAAMRCNFIQTSSV